MKVRLAPFVTSSPPGPCLRTTGGIRRSARGQATIEFALVLPVMLLIALGAVDVGRVFFDYIGIRTAAMEGAIYGSRNSDSSIPDIEQRVRDHFSPTVPSGLVPTANRDANCSDVGLTGFVTVTVTRPFSPLSLAALQFLAPDGGWVFTVRSTAKTRCMT